MASPRLPLSTRKIKQSTIYIDEGDLIRASTARSCNKAQLLLNQEWLKTSKCWMMMHCLLVQIDYSNQGHDNDDDGTSRARVGRI